MDFLAEPIPLNEDQFYGYLNQLHLSEAPLDNPSVDGKPLNLFMLFSLVHKNGGAAKVSAFSGRADGSLARTLKCGASWGVT